MHKIHWSRFWAAVLGVLAGQVLFFVLINRILGRLRSGISKPLIALTSWVGLAGGFGFLGGWLKPPFGAGAIGATWGLILVREFRLRRFIQRYRASEPVRVKRLYPLSDPPRLNLLHPVTTHDLHLRHYEIHLEKSNQNGHTPRRLRVVQLSDLHANPILPDQMYQVAVQEANRAEPDLVFLTGDYVSDGDCTGMIPELLGGLRSRFGIFAILGNHDHWAGAGSIIHELGSLGIDYIGNGERALAIEGQPRLRLVGCEAPWNRRVAGPLSANNDDEMLLVLSHSADNVYQFHDLGARAVFSGHYHAGQFRVPYFGPLVVPSRYGRRFDHGHYQVGETHLFVSAGIGCDKPALRLYCPPDLFVVDLFF